MIEVEDGGFATTVQDTGRFGHYHIGMPPAGAMDQFAHRVANWLVGNDADAATLELAYTGGTYTVTEDTVIAVTGVDSSPTVDGESIPLWKATAVDAGQTIDFGFATSGVYSYLAVAGGIDIEPRMNSRSTYTYIGYGGVEGRSLESGDRLPVGSESATPGTAVPDEYIPSYDDQRIRVVMGLCDYRLTDEGREDLLDAEWTVSDEADRIGYRFEGPSVEPMLEEREPPFGAGTDITNVVDTGYPIGSIQMAGQPIVLMRDAPTGGGYATVGTVISPDRARLAQIQTHGSVTLSAVDVETALDVRAEYEDRLEAVRAAL